MSEKAWKRVERKIAAFIGGKRVPITGRTRGDAPDIEHELLVPEVKYRKRLPDWLHDAMDQAEKAEAATSPIATAKIPCVILVEHGMSIKDGYAVIRLQDVKDWWL